MNFDIFCESRDLDEETFALKAGLTLQTIQAWRIGDLQPDRSKLVDIANRFSVSLGELLGAVQVGSKPDRVPALGRSLEPVALTDAESLLYWRANRHRHWGHLGLLAPGQKSIAWFAVNAGEAAAFAEQVAAQRPDTLVVGTTRNNAYVMFAPDRLEKVTLAPQNATLNDFDFHNWDDDGLPFEIYRALRRWATSYGESLSSETPDTQARMTKILANPLLQEPLEVLKLTSTTSVYHIDGARMSLIAEPASLEYAVATVPLGSQAIILTDVAGQADEYIVPLQRVGYIVMPMIDVEVEPD